MSQCTSGLPQRVSDATIYGLLNGFETTIESMLSEGGVSKDVERALGEVLDPIFCDPNKLEAFNGYYDIEHELQGRGVSRADAILCLKKFRLEGRFDGVIDRIESATSGGSPLELHHLNVDDSEL